jgi:hypothetical protein
MTYHKPKLVNLNCAIDTIQGTAKHSVYLETDNICNATVNVYEGDE